MDLELLAAFAASCTDNERRDLNAPLRVGVRQIEADDRQRPAGTVAFDGRPARTVARALAGVAASGNEVGRPDNQWVTVAVGAAVTGMSTRSVTEWARTKRVLAHKPGRDWSINLADLQRLAAARREDPEGDATDNHDC